MRLGLGVFLVKISTGRCESMLFACQYGSCVLLSSPEIPTAALDLLRFSHCQRQDGLFQKHTSAFIVRLKTPERQTFQETDLDSVPRRIITFPGTTEPRLGAQKSWKTWKPVEQ